ncbi:hypothetical protein X975_15154, partial [Stegodyphus mimosarum]
MSPTVPQNSGLSVTKENHLLCCVSETLPRRLSDVAITKDSHLNIGFLKTSNNKQLISTPTSCSRRSLIQTIFFK